MRRNLVLAAAAATVAIVLVAVGGYVYFFSNLRSSPASLALSASPTASTATSLTSLAGTWAVSTGSQARYRVKELFVGETAKHDAVAQTSSVTGTMTVTGDATGYQVSAITVAADVTSLHSIDTVAGRNVSQRDGIVSRQLEVQQFPKATFTATSASVPGAVATAPVDVTVPGKLTIHGVTMDVTATAKAQVVGDKIEIAGSAAINMTEYGVSPPQVPFTTVDPTATVEFDLFLTRT
ncbi:MAG TPA: YceI family protein [Candidatus Dormibacteraeota bacterium]|nr:YceI family protein [Candidatus Dormibacteraeota bacterium]